MKKITGNPSVDRPFQRIREFRNRPNPKVVVTVDMLSTGVDIPSLEFIVFLRPVKSRILWVQMLGRGTRRCPDIGKQKFIIFDCFDGTLINYFKGTTDFQVELPQKEPIPLEQVTAGKTFDGEQEKWLGYVQEHLVENLTIGLDDFDFAPVSKGMGASAKSKRSPKTNWTP